MATAVLDAWSSPYPSISNRIRAEVYYQDNPNALVDSIIDSTSGHPTRLYHFPGLERKNCRFELNEIDGSGNTIRNLAFFFVVPASIPDLLVRDAEQITVDTTPNLVSGTSVAVFDGTNGSPDYRGWTIAISEIAGSNFKIDQTEIDWQPTTGTLTLTQAGDVFSPHQVYEVLFNPQQVTAGGSVNTNLDVESVLVVSSFNLIPSDFGKRYIIEPNVDYLTVGFPDISTVVAGRNVWIEVGGNTPCTVELISLVSDTFNFLNGRILICPNEKVAVYNFIRSNSPLTAEWRVTQSEGNFKTVGNLVHCYTPDNFNAIKANNATYDKFQYARLYDYIENVLQPLGLVVNYDSWATGNNKYMFSLANSANPSFADKFHVPDLRGSFHRNTNAGNAGTFENAELAGSFNAAVTVAEVSDTNPRNAYGVLHGTLVNPSRNISETLVFIGTSIKPENVSLNQLILV